jgi:hypothetical protein
MTSYSSGHSLRLVVPSMVGWFPLLPSLSMVLLHPGHYLPLPARDQGSVLEHLRTPTRTRQAYSFNINYTTWPTVQCIQKVFKPLGFFHILLHYSLVLKLIFFLMFPPQSTHNTHTPRETEKHILSPGHQTVKQPPLTLRSCCQHTDSTPATLIMEKLM